MKYRDEQAGYHWIEIKGVEYRTDHLAFLLQTGEWPKGEVVHLNGDRGDDRWVNLRDQAS